MTKVQFEKARRLAVSAYMEAANRELADLSLGRNKKANAKRRTLLCEKHIRKWDTEGFWTQDNISAYNMIYKDADLDHPVSPF